MFSLSYTAAYDPYHTVFRYLVLLNYTPQNYLSYRTARIADFFLCFPWSLSTVKAPRTVESFAKERNALIKKYAPTSYDRVPNERVIFERMEIIHAAAISALAGADLIDVDELNEKCVKLLINNVSDTLLKSLSEYREKNSDLIEFLTNKLPQIEDLGKDGLFARTGLGDYQYDNV